MGWVRVCHIDDFRTTYCFRYRRKNLAIYKVDGGVYATDNSCTHEYSPLYEGIVMNGHVYCPKHGSRFDIRTGKVLDLPATVPLKTYHAKIENNDIYVKL